MNSNSLLSQRILVALLTGLLVIPLLTACSQRGEVLRVYPLSYQALDAEAMEAIFEQRSGIDLTQAAPEPGMSALQALASHQAELTLVENSTPFVAGVRAILPAYKSVLHLLAREDFSLEADRQSLRGASIYITNDSLAGRTFIDIVARRQGLEPSDYQMVDSMQGGETDLMVYFGPVTPDKQAWYQEGYRFVSLESSLNENADDHLESIRHLVPQMRPSVIPSRTYDLPGNEGPLLTLEVDMLLVTRKDVPERTIYEFTRTMIQQKPRFVALSPVLFSGINESFDPLDLSFPLHVGARRFLNRDEPSVLERYAETINLLVYLTFLVLTGLVGLARWRSVRKKDRADTFYARVFEIRDRARNEAASQLRAELDALEKEAFELLIAEKLAADESFRIFTELLARTRLELENKQL